MLDHRIYTFLELCNVLNYHKVAENLNITQPAVTQHIKYLESLYNCKLFEYSNRKLSRTNKAILLEKYVRNVISINNVTEEELLQKNKIKINIGATKTIGEYLLDSVVSSFVTQSEYELNFIIDNTKNLLDKLNHFELDILLLEGYVDKDKYLNTKISEREIIGICSKIHPFADKEIEIKQVLGSNILLRESGSGSRNVLENTFNSMGYSLDSIKNKSIISSNKIIEKIVENNYAISFVYDVIPMQNKNLSTFRIKNKKVMHEFNFVYINKEKSSKIMDIILKNMMDEV